MVQSKTHTFEKLAKEELKKSADDAIKIIANATELAAKTIANAAENATKLMAINAAEATKVVNVKGVEDHDLLVVLNTKMEGLKEDIKDLKDGTSSKIADHEARINSLEVSKTKQNTTMTIGIGIFLFIVSLLIYVIFK